jgi:O-Antigen ligase/Chain length determinant protein
MPPMNVLRNSWSHVTTLLRIKQWVGRTVAVPPVDDDPGLLTFLGRCRRLIAVGAILGALVGLAVGVLWPEEYEARAQVFVPQPETVGPARLDLTRRLENEAAIMLSPRAMDEVARQVNNGTTRSSVLARVRVITSPDADLLTVIATDESPIEAARLADIMAETYLLFVRENARNQAATDVEMQRELTEALQLRRTQLLDLAAREPGGAVTAELRAIDQEIAIVASTLTRATIVDPGQTEDSVVHAAQLPVRPVQPWLVLRVVQGAVLGTLAAGVLALVLSGRRTQRHGAWDVVGVHDHNRRTNGDGREPAIKPIYTWFPPLLGLLLLGYMFFSRTFAYLSVPGTPIYVGELVLLVGVAEVFRHRCLIPGRLSKSLPLALLLGFMGLGVLRLSWDFPIYGIDAVRDSAVWYYGLFAIIVAVAARTDPTFTLRLVRWFGRVAPWFLLWVPVAILLAHDDSLSTWTVPGSQIPITSIKSSDLAALTAFTLAFIWLRADEGAERKRSRRSRDLLTLIGIFTLLVLATQSRAALLAALLGCGVAIGLLPARERIRLAPAVLSALVVIVIPLVLFDVRLSVAARELSVQQVLANVSSFFSAGGERESETGLKGTVEWRARYFSRIIDGSLSTEQAIVGVGFGPILSQIYDPGGSQAQSVPPLRNAHNSHITILARMGVAGLALWFLLWIMWFWDVGNVAQGIGRKTDGGEAVLAGCVMAGLLSFLLIAVTDPTFEGPQSGIWAWTFVGIGIALSDPRVQTERLPRAQLLKGIGDKKSTARC